MHSRVLFWEQPGELNGLIFAKIRDERVLQKDFDSAFTKKGVTFALRLDSVFPITTG